MWGNGNDSDKDSYYLDDPSENVNMCSVCSEQNLERYFRKTLMFNAMKWHGMDKDEGVRDDLLRSAEGTGALDGRTLCVGVEGGESDDNGTLQLNLSVSVCKGCVEKLDAVVHAYPVEISYEK